MAKIDPRQPIQKRRTEAEMREALEVARGHYPERTAPDVDDPDIILQDCIEELLQARALITEMRNFAQIWLAKATIKR